MGLLQAGIPVIVFEKNAVVFAPGERDWNIGLHWVFLNPILKSLIPDQLLHNSDQSKSIQTNLQNQLTTSHSLMVALGSNGLA
jgi:hypothetical protein